MQRFAFRLVTLSLALLVLGCGGEPAGEPSAAVEAVAQRTADDLRRRAQQALQNGDFDGAYQAINQALILDPDSDDAKMLAARIQAARGDAQGAIDIAASIDPGSRLSRPAIELRVEQLVRLDRFSEAADALLDGLQSGSDNPQWRHQAWELLNRIGRREEASQQALLLCQAGQATEAELLSLISRTISFPSPEMLDDPAVGDRLFAPGLGKARWLFSRLQHADALEELAAESADGFSSVAAEALYGRLLAENQRWDDFRRWASQTSPAAAELGDYWSAIGSFLIDNRRDEAAAKALLEAIRRNPTDRVSVQRLSKVLYALQRNEDGDQFRVLGVDLFQTERQAQAIYKSPQNLPARKELIHSLVELGRPFETLSWTETILPPGAQQQRQIVASQRAELQNDPRAIEMAAESALMGLDPASFDMQTAWQELLASDAAPSKLAAVTASPVAATPRLVNRARDVGLDFQWYKDRENDFVSIPIHESLGGGIAVLDYDLDGWPDVYLAQGSGDPPTDQCTRSNQMHRNLGGRFHEITAPSGTEDYHYSSGIAAGDVNQDGFADLYLGSLGHNRLLINNGDGSFRDATDQLQGNTDRFTSSLGIGDINGDGLPDLFEANYIEMAGGFALPQVGPDGRLALPSPLSHFADSDRWFENLGDGRFTVHEIGRDIAKPGTSLGLVIADFRSDGNNEVFVGNDVRPNHFLVQASHNHLVNLADSNGLANGFDGVANGCMGIATGDFNRDGRLDMQIANYSNEPANLYLQTATGDFTDQAVRYALAEPTYPYVGFGTKAVDVDRNGFLDFIVSNGHIFDLTHAGEPFRQPPQMLMSDGRQLKLVDVDDETGYWDGTYLGRTIAMIDYDRDGATDFLVGHLDQPLAVLHDETVVDGSSWLQLELVGTTSERDAIGATVVVTADGSQYTQWVIAGDGYLCSDEAMVSVALPRNTEGKAPRVTGVEVRWPSGQVQAFDPLQAGSRYQLIENDPVAYRRD